MLNGFSTQNLAHLCSHSAEATSSSHKYFGIHHAAKIIIRICTCMNLGMGYIRTKSFNVFLAL